MPRLSSVAGYGSSVSLVGGSVRRGHEHGLGVSGCGVSVTTSVACVAVESQRVVGNPVGTIPRSVQASLLRKRLVM